jgi:hypothetical protein
MSVASTKVNVIDTIGPKNEGLSFQSSKPVEAVAPAPAAHSTHSTQRWRNALGFRTPAAPASWKWMGWSNPKEGGWRAVNS